MATYLLINSIFIITVMVVGRIFPRRISKPVLVTFVLLLIMTALFDSLIVGFGIVAYNPELISGIYIGKAPAEDFFYTILAVVVVVSVWRKLGGQNVRDN